MLIKKNMFKMKIFLVSLSEKIEKYRLSYRFLTKISIKNIN